MSDSAVTARPFIEHRVTSREFVSEVCALAPAIGGNPRDWPGLLFYRFVPARPAAVGEDQRAGPSTAASSFWARPTAPPSRS